MTINDDETTIWLSPFPVHDRYRTCGIVVSRSLVLCCVTDVAVVFARIGRARA